MVSLAEALARSRKALRRAAGKRNRMLLVKARHDTREWVVKRRERTRHLIELGGLVMKSGLVGLADDDRAAIYGALLELAAKAHGEDAANALALWRRRGKRAFEAEAEERSPARNRPDGAFGASQSPDRARDGRDQMRS
jgi:hypothetical protein